MARHEAEAAVNINPTLSTTPEIPASVPLSIISTPTKDDSPVTPVTSPNRPPNPERAEILTLSKSIIRITAGYDMQLRQISNGKEFIVDAYAYRPRRYEVDLNVSREEAISHFDAHARKIDQIGLNNLPPEWEYLRDSQRALAVYLREEDKVALGEAKTPYDEYLRNVSGYEPRLIPQEYIEEHWEKIIDILDDMGEKFNAHDEESIRRVLRKRNVDTRLTTQEAVERAFRRADRRNRNKLARILGEEVKSTKFNFIWEETEAFWRFFEVMGPDGEAILRSNWHETHRDSYDLGLIEMYGGHEPSHFIFGALIKKEITEDKLDPAAGLLTIPGPSGFQLEGLAQTMTDILDYEVTQDGQLAVELYRVGKCDLANGLLLVEWGTPMEEVVQSNRKYSLTTGIERKRQLLRWGTRRPFDRGFLPNYARSDYAIMKLKSRIGDLRAFIPFWHKRPLTPNQFLNPPISELVNY